VIPSCSPLFWEGNLFGVPSPIRLRLRGHMYVVNFFTKAVSVPQKLAVKTANKEARDRPANIPRLEAPVVRGA
jgi:hypothetical protein